MQNNPHVDIPGLLQSIPCLVNFAWDLLTAFLWLQPFPSSSVLLHARVSRFRTLCRQSKFQSQLQLDQRELRVQ